MARMPRLEPRDINSAAEFEFSSASPIFLTLEKYSNSRDSSFATPTESEIALLSAVPVELPRLFHGARQHIKRGIDGFLRTRTPVQSNAVGSISE